MKKINITAHTGNCGTQDNSIESLKSAIEAGADIVEFDLRFANDGTPVMTHSLPVKDNVITVEKAFEFLKNYDIGINIDVKETTDLAGVVKLGKKYGVWDRCFFTGVPDKFVRAVKTQCPNEKFYLNNNIKPILCFFKFYAKFLVKKVQKVGAVGINCNYINLNKTVVDEFHKNNLEVSAWTANDVPIMKKLINFGVDNITTIKPEQVKELINNG